MPKRPPTKQELELLRNPLPKARTAKQVTKGGNAASIRELRKWLAKADTEGIKRFNVQLTLAETMANNLDKGDISVASSYRQLVKDIYDRVDRIYGTKNIDILQGIQLKIEENARKRKAQGWG